MYTPVMLMKYFSYMDIYLYTVM